MRVYASTDYAHRENHFAEIHSFENGRVVGEFRRYPADDGKRFGVAVNNGRFQVVAFDYALGKNAIYRFQIPKELEELIKLRAENAKLRSIVMALEIVAKIV